MVNRKCQLAYGRDGVWESFGMLLGTGATIGIKDQRSLLKGDRSEGCLRKSEEI